MTKPKPRPGQPGTKPPSRQVLNLAPLSRRAPADLTPGAAKVWRSIAPHIGPLGLTIPDGPLLASYCRAADAARVAAEIIEREGSIIRSPRGCTVEHPAVRQRERSEALVLKLGTALGLCPAGRKIIGQIESGETEAERAEMRQLFGEDRPRSRPPRRTRAKEETEDDFSEGEDGPLDDSGQNPTGAAASVRTLQEVLVAEGPGEAAGGVDGMEQPVEDLGRVGPSPARHPEPV